MEKITKYQQILTNILDEYGAIKFRYMPEVHRQKVIDTQNHHYLLLAMGKYNHSYIYMTTFHFDIIEDKIWVQCNNADTDIEEELIERGVDYQDIVMNGEVLTTQ